MCRSALLLTGDIQEGFCHQPYSLQFPHSLLKIRCMRFINQDEQFTCRKYFFLGSVRVATSESSLFTLAILLPFLLLQLEPNFSSWIHCCNPGKEPLHFTVKLSPLGITFLLCFLRLYILLLSALLLPLLRLLVNLSSFHILYTHFENSRLYTL